jgi:hypothetical protein
MLAIYPPPAFAGLSSLFPRFFLVELEAQLRYFLDLLIHFLVCLLEVFSRACSNASSILTMSSAIWFQCLATALMTTSRIASRPTNRSTDNPDSARESSTENKSG